MRSYGVDDDNNHFNSENVPQTIYVVRKHISRLWPTPCAYSRMHAIPAYSMRNERWRIFRMLGKWFPPIFTYFGTRVPHTHVRIGFKLGFITTYDLASDGLLIVSMFVLWVLMNLDLPFGNLAGQVCDGTRESKIYTSKPVSIGYHTQKIRVWEK